jgi:hypothetical protein
MLKIEYEINKESQIESQMNKLKPIFKYLYNISLNSKLTLNHHLIIFIILIFI